MNSSTLHTVAGCIIALALGSGVAAMRSASRKGDAVSAPSAIAAEPLFINEPLVRAMKTEAGSERWLMLVAASEHAAAQDMPGLLRAVGNDENAQMMIARHWAKLNPKHMFASLYADYLLPDGSPAALPNRRSLAFACISQWIKDDPTAAIKALNEVPEFSARNKLRISALEALMRTDFEAGLRASAEWKLSPYVSDTDALADWAKRDPRHAAQVAASFNGQGSLHRAIGKAWADSDPATGVQFVATLRPPKNSELGAEIMTSWAKKNATAAAKFVATLQDPAFRNAMAKSLVHTWAETDAAAALAWSEQTLQGRTRTEAVASVIASVSQTDLHAASKLVSGMDEGEAQQQAAAKLFATWFRTDKERRAEALQWLLDFPGKEMQPTALDEVKGQWVQDDLEGARDFLTGPHGALASDGLILSVATQFATIDPEAAMEWTAKLPEPRAAYAHNSAFYQWLQLRPDDAANYARKLPAGPRRDSAVGHVASALLYTSPEKAAAWVVTLPASEQAQIIEFSKQFKADVKAKFDLAMEQAAK